ncbi:MAG: hypothetical protein ACREJN_21420 [Nitrospiraceae bacterium]
MSVQTTVDQINTQTLAFAPAVAAGIMAAETTGASGASKHDAVLDAIQASSAELAGLSKDHANIASISGMINMFVSIFKALKVLPATGSTSPAK